MEREELKPSSNSYISNQVQTHISQISVPLQSGFFFIFHLS